MKIKSFIYFIVLFSCFNTAQAATYRDNLIKNELNCFDQNRNNKLTWSDVCSMPDPTPAADMAKVDTSVDQNPGTSLFNSRVNTFSLAGLFYYYHYDERDKIKKFTGEWNGGEGKYIFRPQPGNLLYNPIINFFSFEGSYASGKNNKTGNTTKTDGSTVKVIEKNVPGNMFNLRTLLGRDFLPLTNLRLTPYLGFGIRYKADQSGGYYQLLNDGTPVIGYDRSEIYYYIPIGLTSDLLINDINEISLNLEYDYLVKGTENDHFSDANQYTDVPAFGNVTSNNGSFSQNRGFGLRSSIKYLRHFSLVDTFIEPYIEYWNINASKSATVYETGQNTTTNAHKNNTVELGCKFGIEF